MVEIAWPKQGAMTGIGLAGYPQLHFDPPVTITADDQAFFVIDDHGVPVGISVNGKVTLGTVAK
jgi:hypothetical protein